MPIDTTSAKEYAALAKLSKANRRANLILIALMIVVFAMAIIAGVKLYDAQKASFTQQNEARLKAFEDNLKQQRIIAVENIRYNTCLNVLPIDDRTPENQRNCFKQADLPGGLTEADFVTVPPEKVVSIPGNASSNQMASSTSKTSISGDTSATASNTSPSSSSTSSSQDNTPPSTSQPSISQRVIDFVKRVL